MPARTGSATRIGGLGKGLMREGARGSVVGAAALLASAALCFLIGFSTRSAEAKAAHGTAAQTGPSNRSGTQRTASSRMPGGGERRSVASGHAVQDHQVAPRHADTRREAGAPEGSPGGSLD